jgi:hypothetical protein
VSQAATKAPRSRKCAISMAFLIGIRATIHPCRKPWRKGANQPSMPADTAICQTGLGRPENASLVGLSDPYIAR